MTQMTGGTAVVQSLLAHGVDTIFGLPGAQNDWFYNALYDAGDRIKVIHTRHEQGAGYMALGAAMSTGKPAVYAVVPGVGMLNAASALATGYSVNAPMLCFTGQIPSAMVGRMIGQLHELPDQMGILERLTKWAASVDAPADAPRRVSEAFHQLRSGRPRPVALECAMDVLAASADVGDLIVPIAADHPPVDEEKIAAAAKLLAEADNHLIFVGSGAIDAREAVQELAEMLQAPVISNSSGNGILSSRHPLSMRMPAGHMLWERADAVLLLGTRMHRYSSMWGTDDALKIVRIDVDGEEHDRTEAPDVGLVARCEDALPLLVEAVSQRVSSRASRTEEYADVQAEIEARAAYLQPQLAYLSAIRDVLPDDGFFVRDVTQLGYVSAFAFPVYEPRTFLGPGYQGTLGWGFATALGVKAANPEQAVVSVCGDGGFMFTMPELATAVQHKLNTVTLVFNDGAYGNVKRMQQENYAGRLIATDLQNPDFLKLAEAFGARGLRATTPDAVRAAIETGLASDVPTIIDVPIGEVPSPWPMVMMPRVRPSPSGASG